MTPRKPKPGCSLAEKRPDLVPLWYSKNELSPFDVSYGSNKTIYLICKKHGEYSTTCKNASKGMRCPQCAHRGKPPYDESLGFLNKEAVDFWSPKNSITIYEVWPNSHYKAIWICPIHGEYKQTCANKSMGKGCIKCGYIKTGEYNSSLVDRDSSFAFLYPELLQEYSYQNSMDPYTLYPYSNYMIKWACLQGHEWSTYLYNRTYKGSNCPHCCNNQTSTAEQLLREALVPYGAEPSKVKLGKWNVDIYFPDSKTVVEYDGSYFHSNNSSYERDKRKSLELLEMGYKVIRIRTFSKGYTLESLNINLPNYTEIFTPESKDSISTEELIKEILNATTQA